MTEHYSTFQLFGGHNNQTPSQLPGSMAGQVTFNNLVLPNTGISDVFPMPTIPFSAYNSENIEASIFPLGRSFIGEVINDGPDVLMAYANGLDYWGADGVFADNGGVASMRKNPVISAGRNAPHLVAELVGAARAAFQTAGANSLTFMSGTYGWGYDPANPYQTLAQIGEFYADPPDGNAGAAQVIGRLQNSLTHPTSKFSLGIDSTGNPLELDECSFASLGPDARVWIEPGDIGNAVDQIPASVADNSASKFRFHPSVFLRRTRYIRSIERCFADGLPLVQPNVGSQPINIRVVNADPLVSTWLIIVDGVSSIVEVDHGGEDLRRPRDIWQQIWVPLITGDQSLGNLTILGGGADAVLRGPEATQLRLGFLSYARYLNLNGDSDEQDDTGQA